MNLSMKMAIALSFCISLSASSKENEYEILSDIDLGFLLNQPKIPWGEDPFLRQAGFTIASSEDDKFSLSGVLFGEKSPMAIINGKMVEEGAKIGSRFVKQIGPNFVILKKKNSEIELTLPALPETVTAEDYVDPDEESQ